MVGPQDKLRKNYVLYIDFEFLVDYDNEHKHFPLKKAHPIKLLKLLLSPFTISSAK